MVSAELAVGEGREADPAGPRQPARHPLDGPFARRASASTARPTRPRSATRRRTAASGCSSRTPSGCSTTCDIDTPVSSSRRDRAMTLRRSLQGARGRRRARPARDCSSGRSPTSDTGVEDGRWPDAPAPAFDLARLDSRGKLSSPSLRGKVVVLNFWASWCAPCKAGGAAPRSRRGSSTGSKGVVVVGVDAQDFSGDAKQFVSKLQAHLSRRLTTGPGKCFGGTA